MRTISIITGVAVVAALSACAPKPSATDVQGMPPSQLKAKIDRCSNGGMDAANDPSCKQASDENFRHFLEKDPKR
jgi:conjugative transfer region protein TrbK